MPDFAKALRLLRPEKHLNLPQRDLFQHSPVQSLSEQLLYMKMRNPAAGYGSSAPAIEALPPGEEEITPHGRHYVVRNVFDGEHCHGKVRLARFSCDDFR